VRGAASASPSPFTVRCSSSPSLSFFVPHRLMLLYDYPQRWLLCDGCLDELLLVDDDRDLVYEREDVNVNVSAYTGQQCSSR
jgi:hypothetical protein